MNACNSKTAFVLSLLSLWSAATSGWAQGQAIYSDSLQNGWQNWGWTQINYNNASPVHSGSLSISVTITQGWQGIYIAHGAFDCSTFADLVFWINGGASGGQQLQIQGNAGGTPQTAVTLATPTVNTWTRYTISLASIGVANRADMDGFWIQGINTAQPTFYLDDIVLATNSTQPPTVTITAPPNGSNYSAPANISLTASVTPNGHSITKVQFYSGINLLNEDSTAPYSFTWTNVDIGNYNLLARVTYDLGASVDSPAVNVTVTGSTAVSIKVDAQANRHPISPLIYGVAFASAASDLAGMNCPIHRSGGNSETRYNWQLNAHNHGADWYFESIADGSATSAATADTFVSTSKNGGAQAMLTIPMIGWSPKVGAARAKLASYSTNKYGPQAGTDWQWMSNAGNGIGTNLTLHTSWLITTNDPNDANFSTNSLFQQAFVQHLTNRWGLSTNAGVSYYLMDNEQSLWFSTHQDVHPIGPTMQEIRDKFFDYAGKVKAVDPNALVAAPEEWGWNGYLYSGYDQQWSGARSDWNPAHFPDRGTNGGWDYCPWLLNQFYQRATNTNQRLLDYFTLHCYPQSGEFSSTDVSTSIQLLRNRSTRQLWDTNYVDPSWIKSIVMLIPRMKNWVAAYYPGTKIGITEYNWGADGYINGATAQADILGIFGRESLDLGTRWTSPTSGTPTYNAFKMFRNYDGNKAGFGDISVSATGPNPDNVSIFAAERSSDGALTIMVINKQLTAGARPTINLTNFTHAGSAQVWQLTAANTIVRLSDLSFTGSTITNNLPAQSITLFILPAAMVVGRASSPNPSHYSTNVAVDTRLSWTAGTNATSHLVFFGATSNAVVNATTNSPEFKGILASCNYTPGTLRSSGRFYWRIDEMAGVYATTGSVWTFATVVDPGARLPVVGGLGSDDSFVITIPSLIGQTYRVERTDSLSPASWSTVADNLAGTGDAIPITDPGASLQTQRFHRVRLLPP